MHAISLLTPISEAEEFSPYRSRFSYVRYPGQRSPISGSPSPFSVQDTSVNSKYDATMDDLWIYDCYGSQDTGSPGTYPRTPTTPSHNRSISLPPTTVGFVPPSNVPLIKEPTAAHPPPPLNAPPRPPRPPSLGSILDMGDEATDMMEYTEGNIPVINTPVFTPAEFPEYSPLEQEVFTMWEVVDQLASAADAFSELESALSRAAPEQLPADTDEDALFWVIEALNIFASDCQDVATELTNFSEYMEALLFGEQQANLAPVRILPRASFSERDMEEIMESAANLPDEEVAEALVALEIEVPPSPMGARRPRDRPPSLKLSTSDVVMLQARLPQSRKQSVGAVNRFSERTDDIERRGKQDVLRQHRAYAVYGDETPTSAEDNWSSKSIVDYGAYSPYGDNGQPRRSPLSPRPRPTSGQTTVPRPFSSPVTFSGLSPVRRPPSLTLSDTQSPRSSHSASSSISSLFSNLPRTFTSISSPRTSPRRSTAFDKSDKPPRFPVSSGNFKKVFTNIFKKREKQGFTFSEKEKEKESRFGMANLGSTLRTSLPKPGFGRRRPPTGSIDATLSALSLSGPSSTSQIVLNGDRDPFAATPPASALLAPLPVPQPSALDSYSSMFNPLKAASRYPTQPLFSGVGEEHLDGGSPR
ncbi:hypothetical protein LXA43DRAFT_986224, partial [Ganoderma leucocontextum]